MGKASLAKRRAKLRDLNSQIICPFCQKKFTFKQINSHQDKCKKRSCSICWIQLSSEEALEKHMLDKHKQLNPNVTKEVLNSEAINSSVKTVFKDTQLSEDDLLALNIKSCSNCGTFHALETIVSIPIFKCEHVGKQCNNHFE